MFGHDRPFFAHDHHGHHGRPECGHHAQWIRWLREHGRRMHFGFDPREGREDDGSQDEAEVIDPRCERRGWFAIGRGGHRGGPGGGGGGGPEGPFGFGHGGPFGFGRGGFPWDNIPRGRRARRGDIRAAILVLLAEQPRNGYQIMQELENRSQGLWRPSPGSVYPALQQVEDEGLVQSETSGTGKVFKLTDAGQTYVKEHAEELGTPWESVGGGPGENMIDLFRLLGQIGSAAAQVAHAGTPAQVTEAKKILSDTRRALYRLLADADVESESGE